MQALLGILFYSECFAPVLQRRERFHFSLFRELPIHALRFPPPLGAWLTPEPLGRQPLHTAEPTTATSREQRMCACLSPRGVALTQDLQWGYFQWPHTYACSYSQTCRPLITKETEFVHL